MNFGLLLSQLPHVQEARVHYDAMLSLQAREPRKLAALSHTLRHPLSSRLLQRFRRRTA
ncbi:hypothetical protein [Paraburkholderia sp. DHOC27]|uniref:hypothetical protein n=1 Tax=Paraburkholderia sp. DHOC27 TaxID=2303330 RepID=UPI0015F34DC7|nr:hypothetical protein [Paraburkholderia sp. DHOC27]